MKSFFILPTAFAALSFLSGGLFLDGQEIDFEKQIAPIFAEHCAHCHGEDDQESGLRLDRRGQMLKGGDYGQPTIVPGKPEKSYLLEVVNHTDEGMEMPPDEDKIPAAEIELLTRWISEGANWPGQMQAVETVKSDHWSFQSVVRPPVPKTKFANPVDAFLVKKLATENLKFSPPADAVSLIRRASIVLTGIAPTPEQVSSFTKEFKSNPDAAYENLVDRLLASPHFGERWAQHGSPLKTSKYHIRLYEKLFKTPDLASLSLDGGFSDSSSRPRSGQSFGKLDRIVAPGVDCIGGPNARLASGR